MVYTVHRPSGIVRWHSTGYSAQLCVYMYAPCRILYSSTYLTTYSTSTYMYLSTRRYIPTYRQLTVTGSLVALTPTNMSREQPASLHVGSVTSYQIASSKVGLYITCPPPPTHTLLGTGHELLRCMKLSDLFQPNLLQAACTAIIYAYIYPEYVPVYTMHSTSKLVPNAVHIERRDG